MILNSPADGNQIKSEVSNSLRRPSLHHGEPKGKFSWKQIFSFNQRLYNKIRFRGEYLLFESFALVLVQFNSKLEKNLWTDEFPLALFFVNCWLTEGGGGEGGVFTTKNCFQLILKLLFLVKYNIITWSHTDCLFLLWDHYIGQVLIIQKKKKKKTLTGSNSKTILSKNDSNNRENLKSLIHIKILYKICLFWKFLKLPRVHSNVTSIKTR